MLLWLFQQLADASPAGAFEKITLRASLAAVISFLLAVLLGPWLIGWLRRHFREPIKSDSPRIRELHQWKEATPTMGGLFLVAGLAFGVLLFGELANAYVQAALVLAIGLALVGAVDDLTKLRHASNGLSARAKLLGQVVVATAAAAIVYHEHLQAPAALEFHLPLTGFTFPLGAWFVPLAILVIVGASNAVNLTDGLDGLAGGCLLFAVAGMTAVSYAAGHAELAAYLGVPKIPGSGEMTVVAGGMIGGVLGFLWFNCHPAQVFMGDTGSLPLGGLLGLLAVVTRQELLLVLVGGVFVAEAMSVILQVGYYKWRRRRIFLCAPLHHHFQFLGWPEPRIVVRFWIASALCAILGLVSLKAVGPVCRTGPDVQAHVQSRAEIVWRRASDPDWQIGKCPRPARGMVTFSATHQPVGELDASGLPGGGSRSWLSASRCSKERNDPPGMPVAFFEVGCLPCSKERNDPPGRPVAFSGWPLLQPSSADGTDYRP